MDKRSTPNKVQQCSKCPGDKEYYCESCPCDLCLRCKVNHIKTSETTDHYIVSHRKKMNNTLTQEFCVRHPRQVYRKYCKPCQVPLCDSCSEDNSHTFKSFLFGKGQHTILDIRGAYETRRHQYKLTINTIKSEALFSGYVLLPGIKTDIKKCRTEISLYQPLMLKKAQKIQNIIDSMQINFYVQCVL